MVSVLCGGRAAGVRHIHQQRVLALGGTPAEYLIAGDALTVPPSHISKIVPPTIHLGPPLDRDALFVMAGGGVAATMVVPPILPRLR